LIARFSLTRPPQARSGPALDRLLDYRGALKMHQTIAQLAQPASETEDARMVTPLGDKGVTMNYLTPDLVRRVDEALSKVGAFGEVRLIVIKRRLRFIQVVRSESIGEQGA
jgi:hypothetical protein